MKGYHGTLWQVAIIICRLFEDLLSEQVRLATHLGLLQ